MSEAAKKVAFTIVPDAVVTNRETVELLEDLVCRAKNGEVAEIAIACIMPDGTPASLYAAGPKSLALLGAIELLKRELARGFSE